MVGVTVGVEFGAMVGDAVAGGAVTGDEMRRKKYLSLQSQSFRSE